MSLALISVSWSSSRKNPTNSFGLEKKILCMTVHKLEVMNAKIESINQQFDRSKIKVSEMEERT